MGQIDPNIMTALDWGFRVGAIVGGWFLKVLFDRLEDLKKSDEVVAKGVKDVGDEVKAIRIDLPTNYVTKETFKDSLDQIFNAIRRVEDKLDNSRAGVGINK